MKINPLESKKVETASVVDKKPNSLTTFSETARVRPGFAPDISPMFKVLDSKGKLVFKPGTYADILRSPRPQDWNYTNKQMRTMRNNVTKHTEVADSSEKIDGRKLRKSKSQVNINNLTLYVMSDNGYRFIESLLDQAIPPEMRPKQLKTDTFDKILKERESIKGKNIQTRTQQKIDKKKREIEVSGDRIDYFSFFHDSFTKTWRNKHLREASSRVGVKPQGNTFEVVLPISKIDLSSYFNDMVSISYTSSKEVPQLEMLKKISSATKINFNSRTAQKSVMSLTDFFNFIPQQYRLMIQNWDKALDTYVKGVRIEVGPVKLNATVKRNIQSLVRSIKEKEGNPIELKDVDSFFTEEYFENFEIDPDYKNKISDEELVLMSYLSSISNQYLSREIEVSLITSLPKEEAEYFVQSRGDQVKATDVLEFIRSIYSVMWLPLIDYFFPIRQVKARNAGYEQAPKTNADGLCVSIDTKPYYVPAVNNIDEFDALREQELSDENGELNYRKIVKQSSRLKNYLVYTDWVNNKLTYTDKGGNLTVFDLERLRKVRPHAILTVLDSSVSKLNTNRALDFFAKSCDRAFSGSFTSMLKEKAMDLFSDLSGVEHVFNKATIDRRIAEAFTSTSGNIVQAVMYECSLAQLYIEEIRENPEKEQRAIFEEIYSITTDSMGETRADKKLQGIRIVDFLGSKYGRPIAETIQNHLDKVIPNLQDFIYNGEIVNIPEFLNYLGYLVLIAANRNKVDDIRLQDKQERAIYTSWDIKDGDPNYVPVLPNISSPKGEDDEDAQRRFKNYQWRALSLLDKSPENAILAVDAGGGKTIMCICNILQEMEKGKVKRPLVACPGHLVKDYVAEISYMCAGKVNPVVINNDTIAAYSKLGIKKLIDASPINTIFITSYTTFSAGADFELYCNLPVDTYRNMDLFRSAGFDGVWLDESHYLKNLSVMFYATSYAIADIPLKRLLTGTLAPNRLVDIVNQFALLDPTVFGTREQFKKLQSLVSKQDESKIKSFAESVRRKLEEHCTFILVKRREWAHELPPRIQSFMPLGRMTEMQQALYTELMQIELKNLGSGDALEDSEDPFDLSYSDEDSEGSGGVSDVSEDDSKDDSEQKDLTKLTKHLSHIELFLSAPRAHPSAKNLSGADLISPKLPLVVRHYNDHMDFIKNGYTFKRNNYTHEYLENFGEREPNDAFLDKDTGQLKEGLRPNLDPQQNKILVFTNWWDSAKETYENLPAHIKSRTLLYRASQKTAMLQAFRENENFQMMIGIGKSMNTGLNLQFCSRLIMMETVWSPGEIEQSLARVFRPSKMRFDSEGNRLPDPRSRIFINFTLVEGTIDIMKTANLITKSIDISRVMNEGNEIYDDLPYLEEKKLSIKNLEKFAFGDLDLTEYLSAFNILLAAEHKDFLTYARDNPHKLNTVEAVAGPNLPGSAILNKIPYVKGMSLYNPNPEQLNLIPYSEWKKAFIEENGWFDLEKIVEASPIMVHTEVGDGYAVKEGGKRESSKSKRKAQEVDNVEEDFDTVSADDEDFDTESDDPIDVLDKFREKVFKEADYDTDDSENSVESNTVKVLYDYKTCNLTEDEINSWKELGYDIELQDRTFTVTLSEEVTFIIDGSIDSKTVREFISSEIEGMELTPEDPEFRIQKKQTDPEYHAQRIRALINKQSKSIERMRRRKQKEEEERKERERKSKDQLRQQQKTEEKRRPGRPKKSVEDVPADNIIVDETAPIKVKVAQFFGYSALMVYGENVDTREVAKVTSNAFIEIGDSLAFQVRTKGKEKKMLDFVNTVSPIFEDGTPITTSTPIIKNPDRLVYDAKKKVYIRPSNGEKFPEDLIDNGYFVNYKEERPEFDVEDLTIESLEEIEKSFANWVRAGRLLYIKGQRSDLTRIKRAYAKRVSGNKLRMFYLTHRMVNNYGISFIVPKTKNYTAALSKVTRIARSTMQADKVLMPNLMIGMYPLGKNDMIDDYNALIENFTIKNVEKLEEDFKNLKLPRGRQPKK